MKSKIKIDKTIISVPGATMKELIKFQKALEDEKGPIITNMGCKLFIIKKGTLFEVVSSLKKTKIKVGK